MTNKVKTALACVALLVACESTAEPPANQGGASGAGGASDASAVSDASDAQDSHDGADGGDDGDLCPSMPPPVGQACDVEATCYWGPVQCTCLDPGPMGYWDCFGGPPDDAGSPPECPSLPPETGDPCPADAGRIERCRYVDVVCSCDPTTMDGWICII